MSLKIMQRRQLQKVLNESTSRTKYDFLRHKRIFIPFSMRFEDKIECRFTGQVSKGHRIYVRPGRNCEGNLYAGWDQIELVKVSR